MADDKTEVKTIWTETILEILYASLQQNKADAQILDVLKEVRQKGYRADKIIEKVEKKVDKQASMRVKNLLGK